MLKRQPVLAPPGKFVTQDVYARKRWRQIQYFTEQFWARWKWEYLQNPQPKKKWIDQRRDLLAGDVVLEKESDTLQNAWLKGIVEGAFKSADGRVKKAKVKLFWEEERTVRKD